MKVYGVCEINPFFFRNQNTNSSFHMLDNLILANQTQSYDVAMLISATSCHTASRRPTRPTPQKHTAFSSLLHHRFTPQRCLSFHAPPSHSIAPPPLINLILFQTRLTRTLNPVVAYL